MATPSHVPAHEDPVQREEGLVHFVARESRMVLRIVVIGLIVATILSMISLWYFAIIPVFALLVAYAALLVVRTVEARTERPGTTAPPPPVVAKEETIRDEPPPMLDERQYALVKRESKNLFLILSGVGLGAVCLAAVAIFAVNLIEPKFLMLAAFVLFAYILLVMAPVWLGWIEDDIEDQTS